MTKKQYFMLLWAVSSIASIITVVTMLMKDEIPPIMPPIPLIVVVSAIGGICIYGFFLSLGMDFANKIGLRFLLLDVNTDWYKDFLRPAIVIGTLYSCLLLVINVFTSPLFTFSVYHFLSWNIIFYKAMENVFNVIAEDAFAILFVFSGVALLIKKVVKNASMFIIIPAAIICIIMVPNVVEYIWRPGASVPFTFSVDKLNAVLLYMVAWLKGFETALLCHVFVTLILSLIVPAVVIALGI